MWPFKRKPADCRVWNEDWKIGDTAECIMEPTDPKWNRHILPWERPSLGQRFIVVGFSEGIGRGGEYRHYFLELEGWPINISTNAFRKVRTVTAEESEIVSRILKAKPGKDRVRKISA